MFMDKHKRALIVFLTIIFVMSAPIEAVWLLNGEAGAGVAPLLMMVPLVAALAVKLKYYRKQRVLGLALGKPVYCFYAVVIPTLCK